MTEYSICAPQVPRRPDHPTGSASVARKGSVLVSPPDLSEVRGER
jgi:hypothetical protein